VVSYDRDRTEGLTVEDMVEALSAKYGRATLPATAIRPSLSRVSKDSDKILATVSPLSSAPAKDHDLCQHLTYNEQSLEVSANRRVVVFALAIRKRSTLLSQDGEQRMNVRPLHDRIIVKRLEEGEQHIGGIIIPDTAKEKPQQGKVIAAGNGNVNDDGKRVPLDVKAGDRILFGKYAGQEITLEGEEYLIMKEDEVLAVIEGHTKKKLVAIKGKTKKKKKK
jgi:chaperonin GroES